MYGHMMGQGHMNGNMHNSGSEWMQHLNNEHEDSDEHFGGFDMQHRSFKYTFRMSNGDFHFQGSWMDFCKIYSNEISHHIDAGRVEHHIHRWESLHNNSNILTLPFDLLRSSPELVINTVVSFLDIQSISELPDRTKDKIRRRILSREPKIILEEPPDDLMSIAESITKKSGYTNPPT